VAADLHRNIATVKFDQTFRAPISRAGMTTSRPLRSTLHRHATDEAPELPAGVDEVESCEGWARLICQENKKSGLD
jgi:hypothetical protein